MGNLTPALPPLHLSRGVGLGAWLAGSSLVFRPCLCAGGGGGQGTALTHDNLYLSYGLRSKIPGIFFPIFISNTHYSQIAGSLMEGRSSSSYSPLPPFPMITFYSPLFSLTIPAVNILLNLPTKSILQNSQSGEGGGQSLTLLITTNN
jgi:hypothetical protein